MVRRRVGAVSGRCRCCDRAEWSGWDAAGRPLPLPELSRLTTGRRRCVDAVPACRSSACISTRIPISVLSC